MKVLESTVVLQVLIILLMVTACSPVPALTSNSTAPAASQGFEQENTTQQNPQSSTENRQARIPPRERNQQQPRSNTDRPGFPGQNRLQPNPAPVVFSGVNLLLGRPTSNSVTINAVSDIDRELFVEYGTLPGKYELKTASVNLESKNPREILINSLSPNTQYYYRASYKTAGETQYTTGQENLFHTQRTAGEGFVFTVESDYHRDLNSDPEEIKVTFQNILNEHPDFDIDLGDTFMCEKFATSYDEVKKRYLEDRTFFGIFGASAPLFLANGNHEGEQGWMLNGTENNIAVWATKSRKLFYPNPYADAFYTGNSKEEPFVGQRRSYYSWEWGDALFVVMDPYWYTTTNPKPGSEDGNWNWTLGKDQYSWFKQVLESSKSKYKFVFTHHVLGDVRGAVEWADYYEWGGKSRNGAWEFDKMRPGWGEPVHQLMVKNNVTILFQGHDHLYVQQEKDGIIYQEVPQPSVARGMSGANFESNYKSGISFSSPGHLRVTVSGSGVTVDYIHTALPSDSDKYKNGEVVRSYTTD
jgi:hypothetical protein